MLTSWIDSVCVFIVEERSFHGLMFSSQTMKGGPDLIMLCVVEKYLIGIKYSLGYFSSFEVDLIDNFHVDKNRGGKGI